MNPHSLSISAFVVFGLVVFNVNRLPIQAIATKDNDVSTKCDAPGAKEQARICAFLDTISWAETGSTNRSSSYRTIVFQGAAIQQFDRHPLKRNCATIQGRTVCSSASGRYQFMDFTYKRLKSKGFFKDFSPAQQDEAAVELIREQGALSDVKQGRFDAAACKVGDVWASFPCNDYQQHPKELALLRAIYRQQLEAYQ